LLTQKRKTLAVQQQIISVGIGIHDIDHSVGLIRCIQFIQHPICLFEKLHGFTGFRTVFFRKTGEPHGPA